jgi:ribosomal protein L12E/L44/L45/RPP1/RPP2
VQQNGSTVGHLRAKPMNENDFKHLRQLAVERPKTKAGLIRVLWPEIRQALNAGHTIAEVLSALRKDGIQINYSTFRNRVAKLKKNDIPEAVQSDSHSVEAVIEPVPVRSSDDPASAIGAQRAKRIKFDHNPFSTRRKDLV